MSSSFALVAFGPIGLDFNGLVSIGQGFFEITLGSVDSGAVRVEDVVA